MPSSVIPTGSHDKTTWRPRWFPFHGLGAIAFLPLAVAVVFNLYYLYPELTIHAPVFNDGVLHLLALKLAATTLAAGHDPTDSWLNSITLGYPLFHHYQHLSYLLPAAIYDFLTLAFHLRPSL